MLCSYATPEPLSSHATAFLHLGLHAIFTDAPCMLQKPRNTSLACSRKCGTSPHLPAAVDALGVGEHQLQLLGKLRQARAGVPRRGDQDLGVALARVRILIVHVRARHGRVVVLQVHLPPQVALLAPQLARDGLALCAPRACTSAAQLAFVGAARLMTLSPSCRCSSRLSSNRAAHAADRSAQEVSVLYAPTRVLS